MPGRWGVPIRAVNPVEGAARPVRVPTGGTTR